MITKETEYVLLETKFKILQNFSPCASLASKKHMIKIYDVPCCNNFKSTQTIV